MILLKDYQQHRGKMKARYLIYFALAGVILGNIIGYSLKALIWMPK